MFQLCVVSLWVYITAANEGIKLSKKQKEKNYTIRVFVMYSRFHLNERFQLK